MATRFKKSARDLADKVKQDNRIKIAKQKLATIPDLMEMLVGHLFPTYARSGGLYELRPTNLDEIDYRMDPHGPRSQKILDTVIRGIQSGELQEYRHCGVPLLAPDEVIGFVVYHGCGLPAYLARHGRKWHASRKPEPAEPCSPSVAEAETRKSQPERGTLAAGVGAQNWKELEVKVLEKGLQYRRAGTSDAFIQKTWGALGMKGKRKAIALLIEIAMHGGTFPKRSNEMHRRDTVHDLNTAFGNAFGLKGNPFGNNRHLGTQAMFGAITWGGQR
ncbi:MAG: hypothetical protein IT364_02525 [Candidatus Hydrogenedentes bacterium]|nr:hypothetical protein [Candidatus Hydrogenedentota bacterium]